MAKPAAARLDPLDQLGRLGCPLLVLDAGVEILGVLPDDDQVDVVEAAADAGVALARAHLGVHVELLPERDVDRAEAAADRRRDRALERASRLAYRLEDVGWQRVAAVLVHDVGARLAHVPLELGAGRLENAARRLRQL